VFRIVIGIVLGGLLSLSGYVAHIAYDDWSQPTLEHFVYDPVGLHWYGLWSNRSNGSYEPSWHIYKFPVSISPEEAKVNQSHNGSDALGNSSRGGELLFGNWAEGGDHSQDAFLEVRDERFLVFSRGGLYHSLYDLLCGGVLINEENPWHRANYSGASREQLLHILTQWKLSNLHGAVMDILKRPPGECPG